MVDINGARGPPSPRGRFRARGNAEEWYGSQLIGVYAVRVNKPYLWDDLVIQLEVESVLALGDALGRAGS